MQHKSNVRQPYPDDEQYRVSCSCGWKINGYFRIFWDASDAGKIHEKQENEREFQATREEAVGVSYRQEFEEIKRKYS